MIRCFQVPAHDEMPSEEMIAWLHEMTQEWDGDGGGITIYDPTQELVDPKMAEPGDYIVSGEDGVYNIVTQKDLAENADLLKELGVERIEK